MMHRIIGVTELQRRFRAIFDQVAKGNIPYVLTRGSRPEAALISYEEYRRFQALQEQQVLARFDCLVARMVEQNEDISEEEVAADVAAARAELNE